MTPAHLGLGALGVLAAALLLAIGHAKREHGGAALVWRWFSGHTWHGHPHTDAGWFTPARKVLHPTGRASRWQHQPRAMRAGIRTVGTGLAAEFAYGMLHHRAGTLRAAELLALGGALVMLAALWRGARSWRHHRVWVRPLHRALGRALAVPDATRPASWLTIPRGFQRIDGAQIRVSLPEHFAPGADVKRAVAAIVAEKLALENPSATWHLAGARPFVMFTAQLAPPSRVTLPMVRELLAAARESAPLLGLGRGSAPVYADLDNDSPHVLVSAGSGSGKSTTVRLLAAQVLARGGVVLVLDIKRLSHAWARGLPGVRYCRDIAQVHDALLWLREELDQRNRLADDGADVDGNTDQVDVGPRLLVLAEEMNATAGRLAAYWRKTKAKDDPALSPAVEALADALFMGRQVRVNVLAVAQMLTARTIGGPEARENMGVRILARYTLNAWRVLVPEIWPAPRASRHTGRAQVCVAGHAAETQIAYLTPAEARELAAQGAAIFPASGPPRAADLPGLHAVADPVGLGAAVAGGVVPLTLDAIRKARTRDPEFPAHVAEGTGGELLYDPSELAAWAANRPRAAASA